MEYTDIPFVVFFHSFAMNLVNNWIIQIDLISAGTCSQHIPAFFLKKLLFIIGKVLVGYENYKLFNNYLIFVYLIVKGIISLKSMQYLIQ